MKEFKPQFLLTRVYGDGTEDKPEIVPLAKVINEAKMKRRGFFKSGITAAAAMIFLDSCDKHDEPLEPDEPVEPELESPNYVEPEPETSCDGIYAHDKRISSLAVSSDGKYLFSGDSKGYIKIWSLPEGALIQTLKKNSAVYSLSVSPDGKYLFSGDWTGYIKIWSLPEGTLIQTIEAHNDNIISLAVSHDGKHLFSGDLEGVIKIWSLPEGGLIQTLEEHTKRIYSLAVSPDGKYLFSGSDDKTVRIWSLPDITLEWTFYDISGSVLAVTPDSKYLLLSEELGVIKMIRLQDKIAIRKMQAGNSYIKSLSVSPNGKWLVSSINANGNTYHIQLWSFPDLVLNKVISVDDIRALIISSSDQWFFFGNSTGKLQLIKLPEFVSDKCLLDLECVDDTIEGSVYSIKDATGRTITYTLPCGSSIPAGATCTCDCVPGKICTCNSQCSCVGYCTCNSQGCSCVGNYCSCNKVCTCDKVCTCNKVYV